MTSFLASIIGGPFSTPVGQLIEKATDVGQVSEDWGLYMEICDLVNSSEDGPKDAIKAIKKQLSNNTGKNNVVILYTLTVLETCVKNCGRRFHIHVAQKDFLQELIRVISPKGNPPQIVVDKVLGILQTWADAFQGIEELKEVERVCKELKDKGMEFPMTDLDRIAPIHTPARSTPLVESSSPTRQELQLSDVHADLDANLGTAVVAVEAEQLAKLRSELDVVQQNCKVMSEMLTELTPGQEPIEDDWQLLTELNATCHHMQKRIVELIERVQSEDVTCELLRINDDLNNVLLRYERYERLRGGGPTSQSSSSAASAPPIYATVQKPTTKSDKNGGDLVTGTLVDLDDSNSAPAPSFTHSAYDEASNMATLSIRGMASAKVPPTVAATSSDGAANDDDFDMFAQSRKGYEQSRQALSGDTYDRQQDDQMLSGLGTAVTLKSKVNPYSDDGEAGEMDKWLNDTQGAQQQSATSSEFDQFLATHTSVESEKLLDPQASPGQKSLNRGGRTLQSNGDDDQMLFSL